MVSDCDIHATWSIDGYSVVEAHVTWITFYGTVTSIILLRSKKHDKKNATAAKNV